MKFSLALAVLPLAFALPSANRRREEPAPIVTPQDVEVIPNKYIVVLKETDGGMSIQSSISPLKAEADHVYDSEGFKGFSAELDDDDLATLQDDPTVS